MEKSTKVILTIGVTLLAVGAVSGALVIYYGRPKKSTGAAKEAVLAVENNASPNSGAGNQGTPASNGSSKPSGTSGGKDYTGYDTLPAPTVDAYMGFKLKQEVIAKAGSAVKRLSEGLIDQGLTTLPTDTDMGSIFFLGIDSAIIKARSGAGFKYPFYEIPYAALKAK